MFAWGCLWCWVSVPGSDSAFISQLFLSLPPSLSPHLSSVSIFLPPSPCIPRPPLCAHLPISDLLSSRPAPHSAGKPRGQVWGISQVLLGPRARRDGSANEGTAAVSPRPGHGSAHSHLPHPNPRLPSWRPTPTCWRSPSLCPLSTVSLSSWPSRTVRVGPRAL